MKPARIPLLFDRRRLALAGHLFKDPVTAHVKLCFVQANPFVLQGKDGGMATFARRDCRNDTLWDWLCAEGAGMGVASHIDSDGHLRLSHASFGTFKLRPTSQDFLVFDEIVIQDGYAIAAMPDTLETVLDIGANCGVLSTMMWRKARQVISVEPVEGNYRQLCANLSLNGRPLDYAYKLAVGKKSGEILEIYTDPNKTGCNSSIAALLDAAENSNTVEKVPTISLEDLYRKAGAHRADLVKCDIEGGEYDLFEGATDATLLRADRYAMEVHLFNRECLGRSATIAERLRHQGYAVECSKSAAELEQQVNAGRKPIFILTAQRSKA
ncbi:MAG: FkbM family methyltransferase [Magnetococcales bacterium]|nr:FkbM family methyltransferase [Magnetococcales bacterium]